MESYHYHFEIINYLECPVKLSPAPIEDISKFGLSGEVVIQPSPSGRMFPEINLQEDVAIAHMKRKLPSIYLK